MQISGVGSSPLSGANGMPGLLNPVADPGATTGNSFSELLNALNGASVEADSAVADIATGGERDLHDVVLAVEMESLAFDLAVQIRNRLLEAYSEIFRMQI